MLEDSVFTNETLKTFVESEYGIVVDEVSKINRGSANIYAINNQTFVLKEFQSKYSVEEINKEIEVINHLKSNAVEVPEYLETVNGDFSVVFEGKTIIMQKFIDGYTMESNTASKEQMIESANMLGKIVEALKSLKIELPEKNCSSWYTDKKLNDTISKTQELIGQASGDYAEKIKQDLTDKIDMIEYVKSNLNLEEMSKLSMFNTHGDYNVLQFIYQDGKIKAVIDFAAACKMPIVWEIIRSYSYIDPEAKDGDLNIDNLVEYVAEFSKYIKLNVYDLKYMAYIYLIQLLNSNYGYKQYIVDNTKIDLLNFGFFRTKVCKFLFKNADLIAKKLETLSK